jgi:D-inositol-3-phosphate glycosyltransferase
MSTGPDRISVFPSLRRPQLSRDRNPCAQPRIEVGLLTGGFDRPYVFGLAMALVSRGVYLDVIGSDSVDRPELHASPQLNFLNLRGSQLPDVSLLRKMSRVLIYYARLLRYASVAKAKVFHIVWNNKFQFFDRTLLMLYYKLLRKRIVFTAHNVNAARRDSIDTLFNRLTLRIQYRLADHIFVHTEKMKSELIEGFGVSKAAVTVIPFGINNSVPNTDLTSKKAKQHLGIKNKERTLLFFGRIGPYKGLEFLVDAFQQITRRNAGYRLVIAGEPKKGAEKYLNEIQRTISSEFNRKEIIQRIEYISDGQTELYFKAADVLVLPYTHVFQSGVLFLAYSFGLPVIASRVGSFGEDIIEGRTGMLCKPCDAIDLAEAIERYFESDLFKALDAHRQEIRDHANVRNSWDVVSDITRSTYAQLLMR